MYRNENRTKIVDIVDGHFYILNSTTSPFWFYYLENFVYATIDVPAV